MVNSIYMYSEQASKEYGANLITLKNGKQFYTTSIFNSETYNDDSYLWKDKFNIYECPDSEILGNNPTEYSKLISSSRENGACVKLRSNSDVQIKLELELNGDFIRQQKSKKYSKMI